MPNAEFTYLEFNEQCGRTWQAEVEEKENRSIAIMFGDQENVDVLRNLTSRYGPFDIIVDDGGHTMKQQIASFRTLFPAMKPGGLYFLEDLGTSFSGRYGQSAAAHRTGELPVTSTVVMRFACSSNGDRTSSSCS